MKKLLLIVLDFITERFNEYNTDFKKHGGL
jgi:hypothetical protein